MLIWSSGHDVHAHAGEGGSQAGPLNWPGSSAEELTPRADVTRKPMSGPDPTTDSSREQLFNETAKLEGYSRRYRAG
jgi:hypothetical protein